MTADLVVHTAQSSLAAETTVRLRGSQGSLEQRIFFDIAYQPLESIILALPDSLARNNNLEFLIDGQRAATDTLGQWIDGPGRGRTSPAADFASEPKVGRIGSDGPASPCPVPATSGQSQCQHPVGDAAGRAVETKSGETPGGRRYPGAAANRTVAGGSG